MFSHCCVPNGLSHNKFTYFRLHDQFSSQIYNQKPLFFFDTSFNESSKREWMQSVKADIFLLNITSYYSFPSIFSVRFWGKGMDVEEDGWKKN